MEEKKVSVIICHHVGDLILRCLESVKKSFLTGINLEVIVVTSTDRVFLDTKTIRNDGGPAHKRNIGVYWLSHGEYIVFLDDDVEVSPYCIWNLVNEMEEHPKCGMGFCKIYNMERRNEFDDCGSWITWTGFLWARAGNHQIDIGQYSSTERVCASKSATVICSASAFLGAGGFDSDYYILGEETDLAWRIQLLGQEVWYFPSAVSWHAFGCEKLKPKQDYYSLERIHYRGCRNYINLLLTNLGGLRLCLILPIHLLAWFVSAAGFAVMGQWQRSRLILTGMCSTITTAKKTLKKRRQVQSTRKVSDRELWPVISRSPGFGYYLGRLSRYVKQGFHG